MWYGVTLNLLTKKKPTIQPANHHHQAWHGKARRGEARREEWKRSINFWFTTKKRLLFDFAFLWMYICWSILNEWMDKNDRRHFHLAQLPPVVDKHTIYIEWKSRAESKASNHFPLPPCRFPFLISLDLFFGGNEITVRVVVKDIQKARQRRHGRTGTTRMKQTSDWNWKIWRNSNKYLYFIITF